MFKRWDQDLSGPQFKWTQGDQKFSTPFRAENILEKKIILFSNTIYLDTILRLLQGFFNIKTVYADLAKKIHFCLFLQWNIPKMGLKIEKIK